MIIKTKTLAVHSIQANMLGTQQEENALCVLLANGKTLKIICIDEHSASVINDILNYYPSVGNENNSIDVESLFVMDVI